MKRLEFSVDTAALLAEIANHFSGRADDANVPGIVMGCNEIRRGLVRIAQRLGCVKAES